MSLVPRPRLMRLVLLAQVPGLLAVTTLLALDERGERLRRTVQPELDAPTIAAEGLVRTTLPATQLPLNGTIAPATPLPLRPAASLAGVIERIPLRREVALAIPARDPATVPSPAVTPHRTLLAPRWRPLAYALLPFIVLVPLILWLSRRPQLLDAPAGSPAPDIQHALLKDAEARQAEMARELHDGVGATLAGVNMLLGTARSFTREPEAAALIATSQEQVAKITQQIRQLSRGIMPAGQARGGLVPALEHFALEMSAIRGVRCTVCSRGSFDDIPAREGGHLFRVVQEATNNALRHGRARRIRITLAQVNGWRRLTIVDDGHGCDVASALGRSAGFGTRSMRARAQEIGAAFRMDARKGRGTRVQLAWKCAPHATPIERSETGTRPRRIDGHQLSRHPPT